MLRMYEYCELPVRTPDFEHHFESFRHSARGNARNKKPEFNMEGYEVNQLRARGPRATDQQQKNGYAEKSPVSAHPSPGGG